VIKTLRVRLTLWHAVLIGVLALAVFMIAYYMVSHQLLRAVDADLRDTAQEFAERFEIGGIAALKMEIDSETASHGDNVFFALLLNQQGQNQIEQLSQAWAFPIPRPDQSRRSIQWFDIGAGMLNGPVRLLALPVNDGNWIEIGLSLTEYESQMHQMRTVFALSLLVMVMLGILASWLQLRTVFRSVEQVRRTALGISEGELDRRIELAGSGQELSDLASGFNAMLDRIQLLLGEMRDVSNHIAHDLRTPVSRIRIVAETSQAEIHGSYKEQASAQSEALATIVEESEQLGDMINTMLEIAQTDAGLIKPQQEPVDLATVLHEAYDLFAPVAEYAEIRLSITLSDQPLPVSMNKNRLQRALSNLIDNALKFTAAGGQVLLSSEIDHGLVLIRIHDNGIGICPDDLVHIFDRFYRSDKSRSKPGNGLGLSYAMSIIRSHGGSIEVESNLGCGSTFSIRLPLA